MAHALIQAEGESYDSPINVPVSQPLRKSAQCKTKNTENRSVDSVRGEGSAQSSKNSQHQSLAGFGADMGDTGGWRPSSLNVIRIMRKKYWVILVLLSIALAGTYFLVSDFVLDEPERRVTDQDFIMLENIPSPNQKHRILIYHYDNGALGYSRAFWAVTPFEYQNLNLANYEIPDGYQAKGWSAENDLLIEKWEPYYYRQKLGELRTGDLFKGVGVKLVESAQNKSEAK